jgi:molybdopterin-guanine dinucleotide biosynthesis protein B
MRIIGIIGWSGSGKTTLITKVIPRLVARGLEVSTIKHAHLSFQIDQPGKDSQTYRMAGASEVLVGSQNRWAMIHELRGEAEPELAALVRKLSPVDLVLVEGYRAGAIPRSKSIAQPSTSRPSILMTRRSLLLPPRTTRCRVQRFRSSILMTSRPLSRLFSAMLVLVDSVLAVTPLAIHRRQTPRMSWTSSGLSSLANHSVRLAARRRPFSSSGSFS